MMKLNIHKGTTRRTGAGSGINRFIRSHGRSGVGAHGDKSRRTSDD